MRLTKNKIFIILIVLALIGFFDAAFLSILHYKNIIPPCTITHGCEKILNSMYAQVYGIPISDFGAIYFLILITLIVLILQNQNNIFLRKALLILASAGLAVAIMLLIIQLVIIQALCQYCMLIDLILILNFFLSIYFLKNRKL